MIPRQPAPQALGSRRRGLTFAAIGLTLAYLVLSGLSNLWTDFLWFDSVGYTVVWRTQLFVGIGLALVAILFAFLVVWANLSIAESLSPRFEMLELGEDEELVQRFHDWVEPRLRRVRLVAAAALSIFIGLGASAWRNDFLLLLNPVSFGVPDPLFGQDVSFYVFTLPFVADLVSWLFNLFGLTLLLSVAVHYLNGGIRLRRGTGPAVAPRVKAHLSSLAALIVLVRAVGYRIDTYELVYSTRGAAFGAGYTDLNARLPALQLLTLISVLAAGLFVWNIWRRGWTLMLVSVGAWLVVSVVVAQIFPAVFQRIRVAPNELTRETEFIARNIEFTRAAYGLDDVEVRQFEASGDLDLADVQANSDTIDNLRLWEPSVLTRTYRSVQGLRTYYSLDRVDTDRYTLDGELTQVMVAVRELDEESIPATDWLSVHLLYTHGFGAVVSPANAVVGEQGQPDYLVRDVPPVSSVAELEITQPRIYFGETYQPGRAVIVGSGESPQEVDFPLSSGDAESFATSRYDGQAGVGIGGFARRLAFALRYRDLNLLISGQLNPESRVLMERNVRTMVEKVAPFLRVDSNPYPVIVGGRIVWVVDLYTASTAYPYSTPITGPERARLSRLTDLERGINYLRNSVKAIVDAYDGTMTLYVVDPSDPLVQAYQAIYGGLFVDGSAMPEELRSHLRYPVDLFTIQSERWLSYHMDIPREFFAEADAWEIPEDPSSSLRTEALIGDSDTARLDKMLPYNLLMRVSDQAEDRDLSYVLLQPFSPKGKRNMTSFLVANSDPDQYGQLIDFRMPRERTVDGPGVIEARIQQDEDISAQFSLWDQLGSQVIRGDLLVVPVEQSIIYIQPIYLAAQSGGVPEFQRAIVVFEERLEWRESLSEALAAVFGGEVRGGGGGSEPPPPGTVEELLAQARDAFAAAETALRAGDLAEYQLQTEQARLLVEEALSLLEASTEASRSVLVG